MTRKITMQEAVAVAERASHDIENWLHTFEDTLAVTNVENVPEYQDMDIDLIWKTKKKTFKIEIKGDRWHKTGNFFFETKSNKEKNTPGCFIYTRADFIFYYFTEPKILYSLPMPATREWFNANVQRFKERETTTPVNDGSYTTVGRLVPINIVCEEVKGIKKVELTN
jgi:hypothetical protein